VSVRWLAESHDDGTLAARVGRDGERLVAEWTRRARLSVKTDGTDVMFEPHPAADPADVEKLRRGAMRLLLAHLAGSTIPLHASAVSIKGRAVVFVGGSGRGKSTLAAVLCEHFGASLLGDDAVAIERRDGAFHVVALEESHWLDAAAAHALGRASDFAEKAPLSPRRLDVKSAPVALIAHLEFSAEADAHGQARLVPVLGLAAVTGLLSQLTRFVVDDRDVARRDLEALADLVDQTRVVRLEQPRRLDRLRLTAETVSASVDGET
jgi:hypothetical protein